MDKKVTSLVEMQEKKFKDHVAAIREFSVDAIKAAGLVELANAVDYAVTVEARLKQRDVRDLLLDVRYYQVKNLPNAAMALSLYPLLTVQDLNFPTVSERVEPASLTPWLLCQRDPSDGVVVGKGGDEFFARDIKNQVADTLGLGGDVMSPTSVLLPVLNYVSEMLHAGWRYVGITEQPVPNGWSEHPAWTIEFSNGLYKEILQVSPGVMISEWLAFREANGLPPPTSRLE